MPKIHIDDNRKMRELRGRRGQKSAEDLAAEQRLLGRSQKSAEDLAAEQRLLEERTDSENINGRRRRNGRARRTRRTVPRSGRPRRMVNWKRRGRKKRKN